jgi:hypothetical protein
MMLDNTYWNVNSPLKKYGHQTQQMFNVDQDVNHFENVSFRVFLVLFPQGNTNGMIIYGGQF